jgi:quinol monooxygenase YgiN
MASKEVRPMYGTIARIHPRPDRIDELITLSGRWSEAVERMPAGFRASYLFQPDQEPYDRLTLFLVAIFDDRESYVANAESPEQDAEYRQLRELLEDDPDWMDGTFIGA